MKPPTLVALLSCGIAALFDWRISVVLALAMTWMLSGRDPLWIIEHGAGWLRKRLAVWACVWAWRILQRFAGAKELVIEGREG